MSESRRRAGEVEDVLPLTPLQEGLLFHALYDREGPDVYTVTLTVTMSGQVDTAALRAAGQTLLERHAALRVGFRHHGVERPLAVVRRGVVLPFREVTLDGADAEERADALVAAQRTTRFAMHRAPLLRMLLVRTPGERSRMVLVVHHILLDGWSYPVLLDELFTVYDAGAAALPPAVPFREHLAWLDRQDADAGLAAHTEMLDDVDGPTLLSELGVRAPGSSPAPDTCTVELSDELTAALERVVRARGWTTNTALRSCWALVLGTALGRRDVTFGATVSGRPADLPGVDRMVGLFINTLPVRVRWSWGERLDALVDRVQADHAALLPHQHVALSEVLERLGSGELFDTSTVFENYPVDADAAPPLSGGLRIVDVDARDATHYTVGLAGLPGERLAYRLTYRSDVLERPVVERLAGMLQRVLEQLADDPTVALAAVVPAAEAVPARVSAGEPAAAATTVTALLARRAAEAPHAPAVRDGDTVLDTAGLQDAAGALAARLVGLGAGPGTRVAVAVPRSVAAVVAVLGVLRAGAAFVALDPDGAPERLAAILTDTAPVATLVAAGAPPLPAATGTVVEVTGAEHAVAEIAELPVPGPEHPAYVLYTSGSTGEPKGVVVPHRAVASYLCWAADTLPSLRVGALLHGPLTVDGTVPSLLGPLVAGGCVVVGELAEGAAVPGGLLKITPSHLALLDVLGDGFDPGAELLVGGEALPLAALHAWRRDHPGLRVLSEYGPTEATVAATAVEVGEGGPATGTVPLGAPLPGVTLRLLDPALRAVPRGVVGEVYLAGVGLAHGYLGRTGQTAARFVADPHGEPGARLYRTGDLARFDEDWALHVVGRADDQVKIRGHRVEPGEVEAALAAHPLVGHAAVVPRPSGEDTTLVGYVVARGDALDVDAVLADLRSRLPDPMVPAALLVLDELPRTPGGKVDRRALPDPPALGGGAGRRPAGYAEEVLAGLFAELLGVDDVRAGSDFFALGGHSLLATRLVSRIRSALDAEVAVRTVFDAPTVGALARAVGGAAPGRPAVRPRRRPARVPLSLAQRRLWFLEQLGDQPDAYLLPLALRLRPGHGGEVDAGALRAAWGDVLDRHEALRTRFLAADGDPYQDVLSPEAARAALDAAFTDTGAGTEVGDTGLGAVLAGHARTPIALDAGLPLRIVLLRVPGDDPVLLVVLHHIVGDGWSWAPLLRDLGTAYARRADPDAAPVDAEHPVFVGALPVQYADHALWQHEVLDAGGHLDEQAAFWTEALADLPAAPVLPTEGTRDPDGPPPVTERVALAFDAATHARLAAVAREHRVSPFMVLQASLAALLTRHGAGTDVPLGTVVSGRTDQAVDDLVGFFVNTLVLRTDTSGDPTFAQLLDRVRRTDLAAFAHQDLPFERLVELLNPPRALGRHPLFQVLLALGDEAGADLDRLGDLAVTEEPVALTATKFDLLADLTETRDADGAPAGLHGALHYASDLFTAETAAALAARWQRLVAALIADPGARIGTADVLADDERHRVLVTWNATAAPRGEEALTDLFARRVARDPAAPAVVAGARRLTGAELDAASARLAHALRARGVGPETVVGIAQARTPELLVSIWAVLRAGGAYLPLDPTLPADRLATLVDDARPALVLTDPAGAAALPADAGPATLDVTAAFGEVEDGAAPLPARRPDALAYVIYTSGSTGRPKGVAVADRAVVDLVRWTGEYFSDEQRAAVLAATSIGFDVSVFELFAPLLTGGRIDLVENLAATVGAAPRPVSIACGVPSVTADVVDAGAALDLRTIVLAGEGVTASAFDRVRAGTRADEVVNLYGPTEATVYCTGWRTRVGPGELPGAAMPAGTPLANTAAYVLDVALRPVPPGVVGELHIAGLGLARGYRGAPGATAGRFVADPFGPPGTRMYRTGDLARWDAGGLLHVVGRADDQIKVRGVRIEPAEVVAVLADHPAVSHGAVVARPDPRGDTALVGYLVPAAPGTEVDVDDVRRRAAERLPAAMVPAALVVLDALPLGATGKLDVRALPAPDLGGTADRTASRAPATPVEERVCAVFAEVLGVDAPGADDGFFDLGGHSLLVTKLVGRLRSALGVEVAVRSVFASPTPAALARVVASAPTARPAIRPGSGTDTLSDAQRRLWFLDRLDRRSGAPGTYHIPIALRVDGALDGAALTAALGDLLERHPALRTSHPDTDGRPRAVRLGADEALRRTGPVSPQPVAPDRVGAEVAAAAGAHFDLADEPPLRARWWRTGPDEHVLLLVVHHIAADGWSLAPLLADLGTAYRARAAGDAPRWSPLPVTHADHVAWMHEVLGDEADPDSVLAGHLAHWRARLAGLPDVLDLPLDRPRPSAPSHASAVVRHAVPAGLHAAAERLAHVHGASLFMVLHAALAAVLSRLGAGTDVAVGTAVAGRGDPVLDDVVGLFVNTVVLRTDLTGDPAFATLLDRVRDADLDAFAHQEMPFDRLVEALAPERSLQRHPLFTVMLVLQSQAAPDVDLGPGTAVTELEGDPGPAKFDLSFELTERRDPAGAPAGLDVAVVLARDLFDPATVEGICARWTTLLEDGCADPGRRLGELELMSPGERERVTAAAHGAPAPHPPETVTARLARLATQQPDAVALHADGRDVTLGELTARARRWSGALAAVGVGAETPVALLMSRSTDLATAMVAVLGAGGAYVPLHDAYPADRLATILTLTGAPVLVTDRPLPEGLAPPAHVLDPAALDAATDALPVEGPADPARLACVMFTSGSTGEPKGVAVTHANLVGLVDDHLYDDPAHRRVLWQSSPGFDAASYEFWVPLLRGGVVVVGPRDGLDLVSLRRAVAEQGVRALWLTAGLFRVVAHEDPTALAGLAQLWVGGDVVPADAVARVRAACPALTVVDGYGPTETTVFASREVIAPGDALGAAVPIGSPMDATSVHLLGPDLRPVPPGAVGEIHLGGVGTARGYLGRPGATAERFVADPQGAPGDRLYRTGDRGRRRADGRVDFLGRVDDQVKLRGFRVEPGEIETAATAHPAVDSAVVLVRRDGGGDRLVGYLVPAEGAAIDTAEVRAALAATLPDYMVPAALVVLPTWPLTPNGKIDRGALPAPDDDPVTGGDPASTPGNTTERALVEVVAEVLGRDPASVPADAGFFALGGDSITSIQLVSRARAAGWVLSPREVFEHQSARALATVARPVEDTGDEDEVTAGEPGDGTLPGLPPIAAWLVEGGGPLTGFAQSRVLVAPADLTGEHLHAAVEALLARHDALRLQLVRDEPDARASLRVQAAVSSRECVRHIRVDGPDGPDPAAVRDAHERARTELDPDAGAMLRVVWCDAGPARPGRLVVAAHHLAVDAVSWTVLVRDLAAAHAGAAQGRAALPAPRRTYADRVRTVVAAADDPHWAAQRAHWAGVLAHPAPVPWFDALDPARDVLATARSRELTLDPTDTATLVHDAAAAYAAGMPDVLCSALALALREWARRRHDPAPGSVVIDLEGHGRHGEPFGEPDPTETVGWFTALYPVAVAGPDPGWEDVVAGGPVVGDALKAAKESLRAAPDHGLGFGLLRHLASGAAELATLDTPRLALNYLGHVGGAGEVGDAAFAPAPDARPVPAGDDGLPFAHPVEVLASVQARDEGEVLVAELTWPAALAGEGDVADLTALWAAALRGHAAHLRGAEGGLTPSDVASTAMSQHDIDALQAHLRAVGGI